MKGKTILILVLSLSLLGIAIGAVEARDRYLAGPYGPDWKPGEYPCGPAYGWRSPGFGYWGPGFGCGYGYGCGWWGYGPDRSAFGSTLSKGEVKKLVQWIIRCNPNLEVGDITKVEDGFEVTVVTRKGSNLVDTLLVEKDTGFVYPVYKSGEE
jgi:hypothetical protein